MTKNKTSKRILFIGGAVLCCILALMLVCNLTIIIKGVINPAVGVRSNAYGGAVRLNERQCRGSY